MTRRLLLLSALFGIGFVAACTVSRTSTPDLTGPSEFGTSLSVAATPDTLNWDGASKAAIVVSAHGPTGQPLANLTVRVDMQVAGVTQDFGTLSARTLVTGGDGKATAVYTAPPAPPPPVAGTVGGVRIVATALGSNAQNTLAAGGASADIRLVPTGVILPPAGGPTAAFTISPSPVTQNINATFDASSSTPGTNASQIVSYVWNFGDGDTAVGVTATHSYTKVGTFTVTLTVMNDRGLSASKTTTVAVAGSTPPSPTFTVSPTDSPLVDATVFFNASGSTPAAGRRIVNFSWDFGDGSPAASGAQTSHAWSAAGTYTVTLTIVDDADQKATQTKAITVNNIVADFSFSPLDPTIANGTNTVDFDGSLSKSTSGIASYTWDFGDPDSPAHGSGQNASHQYLKAASYLVTLTIVDNAGRTARIQKTVAVAP